MNQHGLFYQFSKDGPGFLFENLRIRYCKYEPYLTARRKLLSCQIKMKTMFKNNYGRKRRKYDKNIHKSMRITCGIFQTNNKLFVVIHPKNSCKL